MRRQALGRPQLDSLLGADVVALGQVGDHHRRLGLAVVLGEDRAEPLDRLLEPHRVDRGGAVVDRLQRGQVPGARVGVVHQRVEHVGTSIMELILSSSITRSTSAGSNRAEHEQGAALITTGTKNAAPAC